MAGQSNTHHKAAGSQKAVEECKKNHKSLKLELAFQVYLQMYDRVAVSFRISSSLFFFFSGGSTAECGETCDPD
jgi:hypothetical protein